MKHTKYKCSQPCSRDYCPFCEGDLFQCAECGLIEGELTTDCPGYKVDLDIAIKCYEGILDFKDGEWIET